MSEFEGVSGVCFIALDKRESTHGMCLKTIRWIFTNDLSPLWGNWRAFQGRRMRDNCAPCITKYGVTTFIRMQRHSNCDALMGRL